MEVDKLAKIISLSVSARPQALMGFDGFIDTVARLSHGDGEYFASMASMGEFLIRRNENNCALEIDRNIRKLGGNMPICANALASMGMPVACVGAMGSGSPEPAFSSMNALCSLYPVAMPGECLALEFTDSKLFLADMSGPSAMTWDGVMKSVGRETLKEIADSADLLGFFNWGEIPNTLEIWRGFAVEILPCLQARHRTAVFDLSDCSGRDSGSIREVLSVLSAFRPYMRVVLSANDNELMSVARALGSRDQDIAAAGRLVYLSGTMDTLVHHSLNYARIFDGSGTEMVMGIHIDDPVLVTGGGDHFNAGLCFGLMAGMTNKDIVTLGITVSRLYVSTGRSPSMADILNEITFRETNRQEEEEET